MRPGSITPKAAAELLLQGSKPTARSAAIGAVEHGVAQRTSPLTRLASRHGREKRPRRSCLPKSSTQQFFHCTPQRARWRPKRRP